MRMILGLALVLLAGCAPYKVTVYGATGKQYIAPDLCGAIVACKQANEAECLYNSTTMTSLDGKSTETTACKKAKE